MLNISKNGHPRPHRLQAQQLEEPVAQARVSTGPLKQAEASYTVSSQHTHYKFTTAISVFIGGANTSSRTTHAKLQASHSVRLAQVPNHIVMRKAVDYISIDTIFTPVQNCVNSAPAFLLQHAFVSRSNRGPIFSEIFAPELRKAEITKKEILSIDVEDSRPF